MALPLPPPYSNPIPNNPFYSPEESNVCTQSGVLTLGAGLDVDYATGTLAVAGGGVGTVQQVGTGAGLTGGPITVTGTIALAPLSPSSAGAYTNPTALDVDAYGRITSVTNGAANVPAAAYNALGAILAGTGVGSYSALGPGALNQVLTADPLSPLGVKWEYTIPDGVTQITGTLPVFISNPSGPTADVSVAVASLASTGVVQLNDSVASTSTTEAATPNAAKTAYDAGVQGQTDAAAALLAANNAQTDATQALSDAAAAQATANAAMPKSGGNFTGNVTFDPGTTLTLSVADLVSSGSVQIENIFLLGASSAATIQGIFGFDSGSSLEVNAGASTSFSVNLNLFGAGTSVVFSDSSRVEAISDSTSTTSSVTAASSTAVKSAYDLADAALPKAGGTMVGDITFDPAGYGITFYDGSFVDNISDAVNVTDSTMAASATAVKTAYDLADAALPKAGGTMTGDIVFNGTQTFPGAASVVAAPATSGDPGVTGQVAFGAGFIYWFDGVQWLRAAGSTF